jgi:hypothetical protein
MDDTDKFWIAIEVVSWTIIVALPIFYLLSLWIVPNYPLIRQFIIIRDEIIFLIIAFILRKMNKEISFMKLLPKIILGIILSLLIGIIFLIFGQMVIGLNNTGLLLNLNITNNG